MTHKCLFANLHPAIKKKPCTWTLNSYSGFHWLPRMQRICLQPHCHRIRPQHCLPSSDLSDAPERSFPAEIWSEVVTPAILLSDTAGFHACFSLSRRIQCETRRLHLLLRRGRCRHVAIRTDLGPHFRITGAPRGNNALRGSCMICLHYSWRHLKWG